jgi:hypothetical protein
MGLPEDKQVTAQMLVTAFIADKETETGTNSTKYKDLRAEIDKSSTHRTTDIPGDSIRIDLTNGGTKSF